MKTLLLLLALGLCAPPATAFAQNRDVTKKCDKDCDPFVKACTDGCKKAAPEAAKHCPEACKKQKQMCIDECKMDHAEGGGSDE